MDIFSQLVVPGCFTCLFFSVVMATNATDTYTVYNATSTTGTALADEIEATLPSCPPPGNLHLLCDLELGINVSCADRAFLMRRCYQKFRTVYNNSEWRECYQGNVCCEIIEFLISEQFASQDVACDVVIVPQTTTVKQIIIVTNPPTTSNGSLPGTSTVSYPTEASATFPSDCSVFWCYIWLVFIILFFLVECILLWYCLFYRRNSRTSQGNHQYRRSSTGSMVLIQPDNNQELTVMISESQPLESKGEDHTDTAADDEDKKIFHSYDNLRFIDESSAEGTPERKLINSNKGTT